MARLVGANARSDIPGAFGRHDPNVGACRKRTNYTNGYLTHSMVVMMAEPGRSQHEKMKEHLRNRTKALAKIQRASQEAAQAHLDTRPVVAALASTNATPTSTQATQM